MDINHSPSPSKLACNLLDLKLDNKRLTEELENCKADKEFIWLLWKQFQKESPDLAAAVDMIMTREKVKHVEMSEKASLTLQAKDEELSALKLLIDAKEKEVEDQRKRLSDIKCQNCQLQKELQTQIHLSQQHAQQMSKVLTVSEELQKQKGDLEQFMDLKEREFKQQVEKLKGECAQKDHLNQAKMQQLISLQREVTEYQQQTKRLESECRAVGEKCHFLSQQLRINEQQLAKEREQNQRNDSQIKELKKRLKVRFDHHAAWSKKINLQSPAHEQLDGHDRSWQLKTELTTKEQSECSELEEHDDKVKALRPPPLLTKMTTRVKRRAGSESDADADGTKLIKVLELTEKELFECKVQLKTKSEELVGLRSSHDRRLERMKALELNYKLLLKQLKTYETESKTKSLEQKKAVSRRLSHENSEKVWNELSLYKSLCEDFKKQVAFLEEERDSMQTKYLRNQTTVTELRARLHHQKSDLERKLSAIACIESGESSSLCEISELKLRVEKLLEGEKLASKHRRELEKELKLRSDEVNKLQFIIIETKKDMNMNKLKSVCQSNVTQLDIPPVSQADASVQASLLMDRPQVRDAQVSPLRSAAAVSKSVVISSPVTHKRSHRRTYSDGDALLQQKRLQSDDHFTRTIDTDSCQISLRSVSGNFHKSTPGKETNSQRVSMNEREYSCGCILWQRKAKTLHKQLNAASEQVSALTLTNLSMSKTVEETRLESEKAKRELALRGEGYKSSLKSLQREKQELQETVHEQQKSISRLKREAALLGKRTDADWKRLEADRKECHERCSRLKGNVKSLEENLQQKAMEVTHLQESSGRTERDMKQKRQLIGDLRSKLKQEKEMSCRLEEKVKILADEASTLSETIEQQKHKLEVLRSQLNGQSDDKERLIEMLKKCQTELEHTIQQLQTSQTLLKQQKMQNAEVELNFKIQSEGLVKQHQSKLQRADSSLREARAVVKEFITFTVDLARQLFYHVRKEKMSKSQCGSTDESHISAKIKEIARDTLMLSEGELDDFFKEEPSDNVPLEDPKHFINLVTSIAKSKPPFASKLLKIFTDLWCVDSRNITLRIHD